MRVGIKDFFDFEFFFTIDQVGRWWRREGLIREGWRCVWCQQLLIESWVDFPMRREFELVCGGSSLVDDFKRTNLFVIQLLLWSHLAILGLQCSICVCYTSSCHTGLSSSQQLLLMRSGSPCELVTYSWQIRQLMGWRTAMIVWSWGEFRGDGHRAP